MTGKNRWRASRELYDFLKRKEGFVPSVYADLAGNRTIGYGHLLQVGRVYTPVVTREQAEVLLVEDVARAEAAVRELVKVPLTQGMFDALVSFTFNLGRHALALSTLRKKLNAGDYAGASAQIVRWAFARDPSTSKMVRVPGLLKRREEEREMFDRPGPWL